MNKRLRTVLNIALILIAAAGMAVLLRQRLGWRESAASLDKAAQTVRFTPPEAPEASPRPESAAPDPGPVTGSGETDPVIKELLELDLEALREVNPDVVGWIYIPGVEISQPLLQGPDNDYYLKHTWEKKWNAAGAVFLDCGSSLEDFHAIIYGHRMNNGSMFAPLQRYGDPAFWPEQSGVYVRSGACVRRYTVFAAWEPGVDSLVYAEAPDTPEARQALIDLCVDGSLVDAGVVPGPEDRLLTLSTCTGHGHDTRWVVQAVLSEEQPLADNF